MPPGVAIAKPNDPLVMGADPSLAKDQITNCHIMRDGFCKGHFGTLLKHLYSQSDSPGTGTLQIDIVRSGVGVGTTKLQDGRSVSINIVVVVG